MSANFRQRIAVVLIVILALSSLSCGNNQPQQKPAKTGETEKPPPELEKMRKSLAELGIMLEKRRSPEMQVSLQGDKGGQGNQGGGQQQGGQSQGGQPLDKQEEQKQQTGQQAAAGGGEWREEMEIVRSLHREWNGLEPEAVTKGMSSSTQEALEENLSNLTRAVESRQALEAQLAANQVYRYYIEAASLFKTGIPANLERVRYHVTEASLQVARGAWTVAQDEAGKALEIWRRFSYSLNKIDRHTLNQVEHSLTDLVDAVTEQSAILTSIKTEIALQNLDKLEREIKGMNGGG